MRLLEMRGSYPLDASSIDEVPSRTSPGNYALGYIDDFGGSGRLNNEEPPAEPPQRAVRSVSAGGAR